MVETQALPQALQQQPVHSVEKLTVPVTLWELRVSAWCVDTVELYTQPQCMGLLNTSIQWTHCPAELKLTPTSMFLYTVVYSCTGRCHVGSAHSINHFFSGYASCTLALVLVLLTSPVYIGVAYIAWSVQSKGPSHSTCAPNQIAAFLYTLFSLLPLYPIYWFTSLLLAGTSTHAY